MTRLRGVAVAEDSTLPLHAMIYVRAWPDGMVIETRTDIRGRFRLKVPNGAYEIAICRPGWKAWRGAIRVQRGGLQDYNFELELGS